MPVGARGTGAIMAIGAEDDRGYSRNRCHRRVNGLTGYVMTIGMIVYSPSQNNSHNNVLV